MKWGTEVRSHLQLDLFHQFESLDQYSVFESSRTISKVIFLVLGDSTAMPFMVFKTSTARFETTINSFWKTLTRRLPEQSGIGESRQEDVMWVSRSEFVELHQSLPFFLLVLSLAFSTLGYRCFRQCFWKSSSSLEDDVGYVCDHELPMFADISASAIVAKNYSLPVSSIRGNNKLCDRPLKLQWRQYMFGEGFHDRRLLRPEAVAAVEYWPSAPISTKSVSNVRWFL